MIRGRAVSDLEQIKPLVDLTRVPHGVKTNLQHVRHNQELASRRVHRVFPHLLHRTLVTTGHDGVEVQCLRALELHWRDYFVALVGEVPERLIGGACAQSRFVGDGAYACAGAEVDVTQHFDKQFLNERRANLFFTDFRDRTITNGGRPVLKLGGVLRRDRRIGNTLFNQPFAEERLVVKRRLNHCAEFNRHVQPSMPTATSPEGRLPQ